MSKSNRKFSNANVPTPAVRATNVPAIENESKYLTGRSLIVDSHIATVKEYCKDMAPGVPVSPNQGALNNQRLFNAIMGILLSEDVSDMVSGMDAVMQLFKAESRGALNPKYLYRFFDAWMIDDEQRDIYSQLVILLTTYCDPVQKERYAHTFDLEGEHAMLRNMEPEARTRLFHYLKRYSS